MSRFSALALLVFGLALGSTARAEAPAPEAPGSDGERASELFRNAKAEFAAGNLHEAHRLYSAAWMLRKSPDIAANLAQTELELGRMSAAAQHFSYALRNLLPSSTEQQRAALEQGLAAAKAEVCALRLAITPLGAEVFIDGAPVGTTPIKDPIFVEPGQRTVVAKRSGFVTAEARVGAQKGGEQAVELALTDVSAAPAPPASQPVRSEQPQTLDRTDSPSLVPAYIASGVALAGLGVGVGFVFVANGSADEAARTRRDLGGENSCGSGTPFVEQCEALKDDVAMQEMATTIAIAGFAVGALSGGLATYLFLNASSSGASRATLVPALALTPRAGSIGLRGRF